MRFLMALVLAGSPMMGSANLLTAWDAALIHDQDYAGAVADADSEREAVPRARAQLLPQASAQYSRGQAESAITNNLNTDRRYGTESWSVQVRQPLFRARAMAGYWQAKASEQATEQRLLAARQSLGIRLLDAWADHIINASTHEAARIEVNAGHTMVRLMDRQLKAGEVTQLERKQALQRLAEARLTLAEAERRERISGTRWRQITGGSELPPTSLPENMITRLLQDAGPLAGIDERSRQHPAIRAAEADMAVAREEVRKANADRLPSVDLVASRSFNNQDSDITIGSRFDTSRLMLQASLPLFTSGALSSAIRDAEARHRRSQAAFNSARDKVFIIAESSWLDMNAALARWSSGEAARERAEKTLHRIELGMPAGQATLGDLANAQFELATAIRTRTEANAEGIRLWARWQDAMGQLDEQALKRLSALAEW